MQQCESTTGMLRFHHRLLTDKFFLFKSPLREHVCMYLLKHCVWFHVVWMRSDRLCIQSNLQHILIFFPVVAVKPYSCIMLFDSAGSHSLSFYDIWIFCCKRQVYFILIVWSTWVGVGGFLIHSLWLRDQSFVFEFKSA